MGQSDFAVCEEISIHLSFVCFRDKNLLNKPLSEKKNCKMLLTIYLIYQTKKILSIFLMKAREKVHRSRNIIITIVNRNSLEMETEETWTKNFRNKMIVST